MKLMQERLLVLLAHTYVLSNKPLDAERVFQKVIGQIGPSLPATEGLAELALAKGDLAAAAALFQQVLDEHDPNNANATAKLYVFFSPLSVALAHLFLMLWLLTEWQGQSGTGWR